MRQTVSTIIQYLIIIAIIAGIYFAFKYFNLQWLHTDKTLNGFQVVFFSLSFAFVWVEVLKIFPNIKPFNCIKCLVGWCSPLMALVFHTPLPFFYLFVGLFIGAIFDAVKQRWL